MIRTLTDLIPGKFNIVPKIGILCKKLIATGKNPLKHNIKMIFKRFQLSSDLLHQF